MKLDPYLHFDKAYERIKDEYEKYKQLIIAVDFDDTIYDFHHKGYTYDVVIDILRRMQPYAKIIIWTASLPERFPEMENYCKENNIPFDSINENVIANIPNGRKLYANIILDDRAGLITSVKILQKLLKEVIENE